MTMKAHSVSSSARAHALFFAALPLLVSLTDAQSTQVYHHHACSGGNEGFESGSAFAANLNTVLSTFSSLDRTNSGFHNLTLGRHEGQVNAAALCRGDATESSCLECIKAGTAELPRRCPAQKGAIIWSDTCMFRYTGWYFFRSLEGIYATLSDGSHASDAASYGERLTVLLGALRDEASSGSSRLKFAVGDMNSTDGGRIYAQAQCMPDLDQMQCANCLYQAYRHIARLIPGRVGGRALGASCSLRFNATRFY